MENCPLFVIMARVCSRAGCTLVPLPPALPDEALNERVRKVGIDLLVTTPEMADRAPTVAPALPVMQASPQGEDWRVIEPSRNSGRQTGKETDLVAVLFSSGSTGQPRAWGYPENALKAHAESAGKRLGFDQNSVALGVLPLHHAGGFMSLDRVDRAGAHLVLAPRFDPQESLELMHVHGVTHTSWVPVMMQRVMELEEDPSSSLRCVLLGGDAASPELLQQALAARWPVYPSYGLTETCSQVATATPDEVRRDPNTVGRPLQGVHIEVRDENGVPCPRGKEGRIVVRGATLARDLAQPEHAVEVVTDDHGRLDEEGRVFVTGRDAQRIVTSGHTVSAREVEAILEKLQGIAGAIVLGIPDGRWGQKVVALVEANPDVHLDPEKLRTMVRQRMGKTAVPRLIHFVDRLPRTPVGKKDRSLPSAWLSPADA